MPSLKDRIKELREIGAGAAPVLDIPVVDYEAPHTFNGVELEPDVVPIPKTETPTSLDQKLDTIIANQKEIVDNQHELIKRQKKIQAQVKKIAKTVEQQ